MRPWYTVDNDSLKHILGEVQSGHLSPDEAVSQLRWQPVQQIDSFAQVDHHRTLRQGMPEFIYTEGKLPEQAAEILAAMVARTGHALASRATQTHYEAIKLKVRDAAYNVIARLVTVGTMPELDVGRVLVVAAGTSDLSVAEEAIGVLRFLGHRPETLCDVGVAGIHRLLAQAEVLAASDVLIVVAGMEGALPSVIAG